MHEATLQREQRRARTHTRDLSLPATRTYPVSNRHLKHRALKPLSPVTSLHLVHQHVLAVSSEPHIEQVGSRQQRAVESHLRAGGNEGANTIQDIVVQSVASATRQTSTAACNRTALTWHRYTSKCTLYRYTINGVYQVYYIH